MKHLAAAALVFLLAQGAWTATHLVDCTGGGDFTTMQEAADTAANGDTLLVSPCVYEEKLTISGKRLTILGSGADVTCIQWAGPETTVELELLPSWTPFRLEGMKIVRDPPTDRALEWDDRYISLNECIVQGVVRGGYEWEGEGGGIQARATEIEALEVQGGWRSSTLEDCIVGDASFWGDTDWLGARYEHYLESSGTEYGFIHLFIADATHTADAVGSTDGGPYTRCVAEGTRFGQVDIGGQIDFSDCHILDDLSLAYSGGVSEPPPYLRLSDCLVGGSVLMSGEYVGPYGGAEIRMSHNTVLGELRYTFDSEPGVWPVRILSNIVVGSCVLDFSGDCFVPPAIGHNDFVSGFSLSGAATDSVAANISEDPLFCDPTGGAYALQDCSPCIGSAHDGGDIGRYGVGCQCITPVEQMSWGQIKSLFRQLPN